MKKSLLFSLLTICTINSALAENIQNLDTPVNWSALATFNTIMNLHQDDPNAFSIADRVAGGISIWGGPRSAKWLCEYYNGAARSVGSKVYNCSDVIKKVITAHNNIVLSQKNIKIIDKLMPDTKVYWNPVSVSSACTDTYIYVKENGPTDVSLSNKNAKNAKFVCNDRETLDLYNKPYSINELFDVCRNFFFTSSNSFSLNKVCSMFVDKALEEHNSIVTNQEQIKYDDNFQFKYTTDKEIEEKFLSYNKKIIDHSNRSFDFPAEAHIWASFNIQDLISNDITDIKAYDLYAECSGDCNKFGDDTVMCDVRYKTYKITVKYIFDDICAYSLIDYLIE